MAPTKSDWRMSFSLSAKDRAEGKGQSVFRPALSSALCRRSGCSPAEPYPPPECLKSTILMIFPPTKGTFLLCQKGDISILG
jgi:hypothetical protein